MYPSMCKDFMPIKPSFTQRAGRFLGAVIGYGTVGAAFGAAATMATGIGGAAFTAAALLTPPVVMGAAVGAAGVLALHVLNPNMARSFVGKSMAISLLAGLFALPPLAGVYVDTKAGPVSGILAVGLTAFAGGQLFTKYILKFGLLPPFERPTCSVCTRSCKRLDFNHI